ncbi:hypothetical protein LMG7053_05255 [Achromobacter ruhlandii]|uniref:Uncharacterized protein n=1 Tax=Achromobacter ruhlandii TaxID=72557 RepID=A0ABM8M3N1_9BURK|nr:hypothetical protein LMG7053_05255 [Achromobacter ruhlandii]
MENELLKFCKDCKHYRPYPSVPIPWASDYCLRHAAEGVDLTSGEKYLTGALDPKKERHADLGCGPDARYFEKRLTFWGRILKK